jgi:hypothetical protein
MHLGAVCESGLTSRQLPLVCVSATTVVGVVVAVTGVAAHEESLALVESLVDVTAVVVLVLAATAPESSLVWSAACAIAPPMATNAAVLATAVARRARRAGCGLRFRGWRIVSFMPTRSARRARATATGGESHARTAAYSRSAPASSRASTSATVSATSWPDVSMT